MNTLHTIGLGSKTWLVGLGLLLGLGCGLTLWAAGSPEGSHPSESGEWVSIFNGQDLEGWTPKIAGFDLGEDPNQTFRVEDGKLVVSYNDYDDFGVQFGHLFYKTPFSNYRIRIEYRFVGDQCPGGPNWAFRNSGIMFHCQNPETMRADQSFPVSIEAQMLGGNGTDPRSTGNLCTPGTHVVIDDELVTRHCTTSESETYHGDQWVTMELVVNGSGRIEHIVNGEMVLVYEQPQLDSTDADAQILLKGDQTVIDAGYISLQAESHPLEFRKVEIMVLED